MNSHQKADLDTLNTWFVKSGIQDHDFPLNKKLY